MGSRTTGSPMTGSQPLEAGEPASCQLGLRVLTHTVGTRAALLTQPQEAQSTGAVGPANPHHTAGGTGHGTCAGF